MQGPLQIVGLSGSPRPGGNTDDSLGIVLDGLRKSPEAATRLLRVSDYRIEPCRGCRSCMELKRCVISDDEQSLLEDELGRADVIILGAPVYWFGVPGPLKNFLDRTHGHYAGTPFLQSKIAAIVTVAADSGFAEAERAMSSVLSHFGAEIISRAWVYARDVGDLLARPAEIAKVRQLTTDLCNRLGLSDCASPA